jgi:hypothetical protein
MGPAHNMAASKKPDSSSESLLINRLPELQNREITVSTRGWTRSLPSSAPSWPSKSYLTRLAQWATPAARRADLIRYRAHRLPLRVDQRYTPLVPSRLRVMTTAEELPDPEPSQPERSDESGQSDAQTIDTALSDKSTNSSTSG